MTMKQAYINYVKSIYPEMVEDYWYPNGELHFYMSETHKESGEDVFACIRLANGKFIILRDF